VYNIHREDKKGKMQKVLKRIQKVCPSLKFKVKRIYRKDASSYTKSNKIHSIKTSCIRETYAQGVTDHRFVKQGWYPHLKTPNGWRPVALGTGDYADFNKSGYPDYLHYYTISKKKGRQRRLTKHIIDINKEVIKCVKKS